MYRDRAIQENNVTSDIRDFIAVNNKTQEVFPHNHGRWACVACGAWRWLAFLASRPEYAVGKVINLVLVPETQPKNLGSKLPEEPNVRWRPLSESILARTCPRCHFAWYVKLYNEK